MLGSVTVSNSTIVVRVRAIAMATPAAYAIPSAATPPAQADFSTITQTIPNTSASLEAGDPERPVACHLPCLGAKRPRVARRQRLLQRMSAPTRNKRPLERKDGQPHDRKNDPQRAPRTQLACHVRAAGIETDDRYRERLLDPARKLTPRGSVRERLRPAELEQTNRLDHTGANADEQRQACVGGPVRCTAKTEDNVVVSHAPDPTTVRSAIHKDERGPSSISACWTN